MASNSRQRSNSSGSDIRVVRGGKGRSSKAASRRAGGASKAAASSRTKRLANPAVLEDDAHPTRQLESRTIASLRLEADREARNGQARRAREARAREREERRAKQERKSRLPVIIACVVVGLALSFAAMYYILANTNIFEIEELEFQGADHLTSQEASALVTIPQGTTLLNIDTAQIAESLERDAWVQSVDVVKEFPHKLKVIVHEREIGAIVEVTTGQAQTIQNWAISDDGMWLMVVPSRSSEVGSQLAEKIYEDAEQALHIVGVPYGLEPQIGTYCTDPNVDNALKILTNMTTELADQLKVINAAEAESIVLTLDSNIQIAFGTPDNIREKERICLQIMKDNPTVVYINVRVPDRPTWRAA